MAKNSISVAIVGYDGVQTLDLSGPLDAFASANSAQACGYLVRTVSCDGVPFCSESGLKIVPDGALSDLEWISARAHLSPRQFSRRFTQVFGCAPAAQIEALRLDVARDHLEGGGAGVDAIASSVGFRSDDAFRRAFARRFGIAPIEYRRRFGAPRAPTPLHALNNFKPGDLHVDLPSL